MLPWGVCSEDSFDLSAAKTILDEDHYGMTEVKKRVLVRDTLYSVVQKNMETFSSLNVDQGIRRPDCWVLFISRTIACFISTLELPFLLIFCVIT